MHHTPLKLSLMALTLAGIVFFTNCKRNNQTKDNDTTVANDNALGEFVYNDVLNIADEASTLSSGDNLTNYKTTSNCATITHDTTTNPKTITVDFGSVNCLCNDGRNRRGQILISYTGHYKDSGSVHTITFNNYFVNDNEVLGTKSVQNMGTNTLGQSYFNVNVTGKIILASTGDSIIWNSTRVRTWTQGESTQTRMDDVYEITGSGNGSRANGVSYTMNIIQPLVKEIGCKWMTSGKVEIQPTGKPLRTIDYGNGTCDNDATLLINGNTYNITLH